MLHLSQVQQLPKILERQTKAVFPLYLYLLLLMCRYFTALRLLEATMIYYLKSSECFMNVIVGQWSDVFEEFFYCFVILVKG